MKISIQITPSGSPTDGSLSVVFRSAYELTLQVNNESPKKYSSSWGQDNATFLANYLHTVRKDPVRAWYDVKASTLLWNFLFANLDESTKRRIFSFQPGLDTELYISTTQADSRILTNIPWELSFKTFPDEAIDHDDFSNTLSAVSMARMIRGTKTRGTPNFNEGIRVFCGISDPEYKDDKNNSLDPGNFSRDIKEALDRRSAYVGYNLFAGAKGDFQIYFTDLITELKSYSPQILVLVCHGRTVKGKPSLRFRDEWVPVATLAQALIDTQVTMVYLVACDLTWYDEDYTSASGAAILLDSGIPAVVAMQSSILVSAGNIFIEQLINYLFPKQGDGAYNSHLRCIANARSDIRRRLTQGQGIDWAFPALFVTEDSETILKGITGIIDRYPIMIKWLWVRNFKNINGHFPRPEPEKELERILTQDACGLYRVAGPKGSGKSHLIKYIGDRVMRNAYEKGTGDLCPILYIDLDPEKAKKKPAGPLDLYELLTQRLEEITPPDASLGFFKRLPNIGSLGENALELLREYIDGWKAIVIFDNLDDTQYDHLSPFFEMAKNDLKYSLVISCSSTSRTGDLVIGNLREDEVNGYLESLVNSNLAGRENIFAATGGNFLLLSEIAGNPQLLATRDTSEVDFSELIDLYAATMIEKIEQLGEDYVHAAFVLSLLPKGLSKGLSRFWIRDWGLCEKLYSDGFISSTRKGTQDWLFVPYFIAESWQFQYDTAFGSLKDDQIAFFLKGREEFGTMEAYFTYLLQEEGGFEYITSIFKVLTDLVAARNETRLDAQVRLLRSIPMVCHKLLYRQGRWYRSYELWSSLLKNDEINIPATYGEWLAFGKSASLIGLHAEARNYLERARSLEDDHVEDILRIDRYLLEAKILKNEGAEGRFAEIVRLYDDSYNMTIAKLSDADLTKYDRTVYTERQALNRYDYAIIKAWWQKDLDEAFRMMDEALELYRALGDEMMVNVILKEQADILIDKWDTVPEYETRIESNLTLSEDYFESKKNFSELVEIYYRWGRYYKRKVHVNKNYLSLAIKYYEICRTNAQEVGNLRFKLFAEGHAVVLRFNNDLISPGGAIAGIDPVIDRLKKFYSTGSWENRMVRNFLYSRSKMFALMGDVEQQIASLEEAFNSGTTESIPVTGGTDGRRLREIVNDLLSAGQEKEDRLIKFYHRNSDKLDKWLGIKSKTEFYL